MAEGQGKAGPSLVPNHGKKRQRFKKQAKPLNPTKVKRLTEKQQIEALDRNAMAYVSPADSRAFTDLPISEPTKKGLKKASFVKMTDIQTKSLPVSLKGKDVLGAARTGSGKTLAFLIPVLEILYRRKWGPSDGLGALIISPTRELAVQIFDVLRSIGPFHAFSAGLVIGGKNLKDERDRLSRMNILVATPGRLLQHMDQTVGFDADNLQILVLDEADRILDMGFQRTLSALLSHLPKSRQTLLFSATQTQSVHDLARLSLKDPEHIGIKESGEANTFIPENLEQHFVITELDKKLDILWSFIKTHLQSKILVFMSSCKQVRFVFETFCKMHPGVPLLHLHGKLKQTARLSMYTKFTTSSHAVLFATDIAARGLDFPSVDWVVQVDAPEDAETYIHRVGRTARYESKGKGLLFLLPSEEEGMKNAIEKKGLDIKKIKIRPSKTHSIENQLQNLCFQDPDIKYLAQRAFVSYVRSVYLHKDKSVFKVDALPVDRFAESLGLPGTPKIKFLNREIAKLKKNASREVEALQTEATDESSDEGRDDDDDGDGDDVSSASDGEDEGEADEQEAPIDTKPPTVRTKYDRMFERKNQNILSDHYTKLVDQDAFMNGDDEDDFITLKRADHDIPGGDVPLDRTADLSKRKLKLGRAKRAIAQSGVNTKLTFDDEGKPHELYELADGDEWFKEKGGLAGAKEEGKKFAEEEIGKMQITNVIDKEEAKEKKREKKRKRKEKESGKTDENAGIAFIKPTSEDEGYLSPQFDLPDESSEDEQPSHWQPPPAKRLKAVPADVLDEEEELALRLLRKR